MRIYRVILVFYLLAAIAAVAERTTPEPQVASARYDAARTFMERYPERPEHLYVLGLAAMEGGQIDTAIDYFEAALDTHFYANEGLLHHHARLLVETGAPKHEVAAAAALWEKHFPYSKNPHPREYR